MKLKLFYDITEITTDRGRQLVEHKGQVFSLEKSSYGFTLTNITEAGLKAKECQKLSVWVIRDIDNQMDWWNEFLSPKREEIFTTLKKTDLSFEEIHKLWKGLIPVDILNFSYETEQSIRFWPFHDLSRIKPLKKSPKKWNITTAIRAIVNNQFKSLQCTGIYTDDYRHDASVDFHKGEIGDPVAFARRIYESPYGWWVSSQPDNNGRLSLCCSGFNNNYFIPVIKTKRDLN